MLSWLVYLWLSSYHSVSFYSSSSFTYPLNMNILHTGLLCLVSFFPSTHQLGYRSHCATLLCDFQSHQNIFCSPRSERYLPFLPCSPCSGSTYFAVVSPSTMFSSASPLLHILSFAWNGFLTPMPNSNLSFKAKRRDPLLQSLISGSHSLGLAALDIVLFTPCFKEPRKAVTGHPSLCCSTGIGSVNECSICWVGHLCRSPSSAVVHGLWQFPSSCHLSQTDLSTRVGGRPVEDTEVSKIWYLPSSRPGGE